MSLQKAILPNSRNFDYTGFNALPTFLAPVVYCTTTEIIRTLVSLVDTSLLLEMHDFLLTLKMDRNSHIAMEMILFSDLNDSITNIEGLAAYYNKILSYNSDFPGTAWQNYVEGLTVAFRPRHCVLNGN